MKLNNKFALIALFACIPAFMQSSAPAAQDVQQEDCKSHPNRVLRAEYYKSGIECHKALIDTLEQYNQMQRYALYAATPMVALTTALLGYELYKEIAENNQDQDFDDSDEQA